MVTIGIEFQPKVPSQEPINYCKYAEQNGIPMDTPVALIGKYVIE